MKIGILTMNYAKNYGGILQCYGLYKYLGSKGHDIKIINYVGTGKRSILNYLSKIPGVLMQLFSHKPVAQTKPKSLSKHYLQNFVDFRNNYLVYTELVNEHELDHICEQFDAVVVGSDQIWNDINTRVLAYYFDWKFEGKKIAYAPCTILDRAPLLLRYKIKKLLLKFDALSARDLHTADYVASFKLPSPQIVVDPSCLWDYGDLLHNENPVGEPYILTYILGSEIKGGNMDAISRIKRIVGNLKIVSVCIPSVSTICEEISDIVYYEASPVDWINLFYHASFVYTDSFHGIMFSLKFHKQFVAYCKDSSRQSRMLDLIMRYNLTNIIDHSEKINVEKGVDFIDYSSVDNKLCSIVQASQQFLNDTLLK